MNRLLVLSAAAVAAIPLVKLSAAPPARVKPADIRADRELLITHPAVVDSEFAKYPGPWSFGALLEQLVGAEHAPGAARDWLEQFYFVTHTESPRRGPGFDDPAMRWLAMHNRAAAAAIVTAIGGETMIPSRGAIWSKIIEPWQRRDGFDPSKGGTWTPKLQNAPFRLLAIVNRMDIAAPAVARTSAKTRELWNARGMAEEFDRLTGLMGASPVYYGGPASNFTQTNSAPETAGEGRLVFGAVGPDGRALAGGWTLIFEYPLTKQGADSLMGLTPPAGAADLPFTTSARWAYAWHRLGEFELGDHRYNESLAEVTRAFTHQHLPAGPGAGADPQPLFNQLRTSEAAFGSDRVFRQFQIAGRKFLPASLPLTPANDYAGDRPDRERLLSRFLRVTQPFVIAGLHRLPPQITDGSATRPFLASHSVIPAGKKAFHWDPHPATTREARRIFSMSTCNGCHAAETNCPDGLHIHPRNEGEAAKLSAFLRVDGKPNRLQDPGLKTLYVQQEEMQDRARFLAAFLDPRASRQAGTLDDLLRDRLRRGH